MADSDWFSLLQVALDHAQSLGVATRRIDLNRLRFRACEGYYSKAAHACTWPCSITQMDPEDQLDQVYEAFVHWADVILIATPIRWGAASQRDVGGHRGFTRESVRVWPSLPEALVVDLLTDQSARVYLVVDVLGGNLPEQFLPT